MGNIGIRNLAGIGVGDIDVYGTRSQQKILSINFKSHRIDKEKHVLVFEVIAPILKNTAATIYVEEIDKYVNDSVLTDKQSIKSNGTTIVTTSFNKNMNFTESFFDDGNTFQATITCDGLSGISPVFNLNSGKKQDEKSNIQDPKKQKVSPLILTTKQKQQFIAVVLGETQNGDPELWNIVWVYFNLVKDLGFDKAMKRSSFYNKKPDNYKLFMFVSGEGNEFENDLMDNGNKIKDWVLTDYFINGLQKKADLYKTYLDNNVFIKEPINPFVDWEGQGYWADLNLLPPKNNEKWYQARQYYWLQVQENKNIKFRLIKILEDGFSTSFIFDEKKIILFFKEKPELLPKDYNKIKNFYYERN